MSIEIIEKPTCKCNACGCVYSFGKNDFQEIKEYVGLREVSYMTPHDVYEIRTFVQCPICGAEHVIKRKSEYK